MWLATLEEFNAGGSRVGDRILGQYVTVWAAKKDIWKWVAERKCVPKTIGWNAFVDPETKRKVRFVGTARVTYGTVSYIEIEIAELENL